MKKTFALLLTLITLLSLIPVSAAAASVEVTPQIAIDCFEKFLTKTPKAEDSSCFSKYKGYFYADMNKDDIPELFTVFSDSSNWDYCVNVYYCNLDFDMSNGLENSTPEYTAVPMYVDYGYGYVTRDMRTYIGGSGGTNLHLVRLKDGRLALAFEEFGFGSNIEYYTYSEYEGGFVKNTSASVSASLWTVNYSMPGTYEFYPKPDPNSPFLDVKSSDYFYEAVLWALENGVTKGTTATRFVPSTTCTRQQVVTFLYRANGSPAVTGSNPFKDVKPTDYSYNAILWAVANGITQGTTATTFNPTGTCSTAHVLTFLYRAKGCPEVQGAVGTKYYDAAAQWAKEIGLYDALPFGFEPGRSAPRAEIVTYLFGTKDIAAPEKPAEEETPVAPAALPDGRYEVYFKRSGVFSDTLVVDTVQYLGLTPREVNNLKKGQVLAFSALHSEAPDITVNTWQIADTAVFINNKYEFWYNAQTDRFIYCDYELDPSGAGLPYVLDVDLPLKVSPNATIEDWSSAMLRTHPSMKVFFDNAYGDTYLGSVEIKDGEIVLATINYHP